ncbi:glycosyl hydrolase [Conexibacter stalactiti]|uniref:Glycosyl hydrolase n=1 Tax=Conexibacter stalactiti TaxID=1940611 RepID=A0ABU4HIE5_9ACTN|nr:glycosyl hydrolase [Conexibacter stalactiti]MDW5593025.1 glycosyl hydrolase [Conexibacter stalactiti]MEC5033666.1 glycosyl hydrolase [Conexibacter stalactiti]
MAKCKRVTLAITVAATLGAATPAMSAPPPRAAEASAPFASVAWDPLKNPGAFLAPPNDARPKIRWWWAAPYDTDETRRELEAIKAAGFSGAEIAYDAASWATDAQRENLGLAIDFASRNDFEIDMTVGASWPVATPATRAGTDLSQKELQYGRADVAGGGIFSGSLPYPYDDPTNARNARLVAVTAARVSTPGPPVQPPARPGGTINPPATSTVLDPSSLRDITDQVSGGNLTWTAPTGDWIVFAFWSRDTAQGARGVASLFDTESINAAAGYVSENQIGPANTDPLRAVGGSFFEDSLELNATSAYWSRQMLSEFKNRRGYDLTKYLPLIFRQGEALYKVKGRDAVPDFDLPSQAADRVRADYHVLLDDLYADEHIDKLADWSANYDMRFRTQAAYGDSLNTSRGAREVAEAGGLPDDESLNAGGWFTPPYDTSSDGWFQFMMDHYRSVAGGAHQGGENEVGNELGANRVPFQMTLRRYEQLMNIAWATGVSRPIPHGYNYQATGARWPGTSRFSNGISETWNADTYPQWSMWKPLTDYWARGTYTLMSGSSRSDVAVLYDGFITSAADGQNRVPPRALFDTRSMETRGYQLQYIDSDGIAQPEAQGNGTLFPRGPAYRAVVINQKALRPDTAEALADQVEKGLAIVFVGERPNRAATNLNPKQADARVAKAIERMVERPSVRQVAQPSEVGAALQAIGVRPDIDWSTGEQVYGQHRETASSDIYYIHNPTTRDVAFSPAFKATGRPQTLDLWTGEIRPVSTYSAESGRVTVPINLEAGENVVIAFPKGNLDDSIHVVASDAEAIQPGAGSTVDIVDTGSGTRTLKLSNGHDQTASLPALPAAVTATNWKLTVRQVGPEPIQPTIEVDLADLTDWRSIDALRSAAGIGTYETIVNLPDDWTAAARGAYLDLGRVEGGSAQAYVNGTLASAAPVAADTIDVSSLLRSGGNTIKVVFASTLRNKLTAVVASGATETTGLIGPVRLTPYNRVTADLRVPSEQPRPPVEQPRPPIEQLRPPIARRPSSTVTSTVAKTVRLSGLRSKGLLVRVELPQRATITVTLSARLPGERRATNLARIQRTTTNAVTVRMRLKTGSAATRKLRVALRAHRAIKARVVVKTTLPGRKPKTQTMPVTIRR